MCKTYSLYGEKSYLCNDRWGWEFQLKSTEIFLTARVLLDNEFLLQIHKIKLNWWHSFEAVNFCSNVYFTDIRSHLQYINNHETHLSKTITIVRQYGAITTFTFTKRFQKNYFFYWQYLTQGS